ncbi:hypothetical protein C3F09_06525, partial [candidate division GN15 bacterium]
TNLTVLQRKLRWRNEIGAAAITRDRRSAELDNSGVPGFIKDLFMPRKSSGVDYAYTSDLNLDLKKISFTAGFHYIGPGYVSLGLASLISDKREMTAGAVWRFRRGQVRLDGALQQDNLINQKSYTTDRNRVSATVAYRIRRNWNATFAAAVTGMTNDSRSDTTRIDYTCWILRTGQVFSFQRQVGIKSVTADYTYQHAADGNPLRKFTGTTSHSATATAVCGVNASLEILPSVGLISTRAGGNRILTQIYTVSGRYSALRRRLVSNATMTVSVADVNTTLRPNLRSSYDLGHNFAVTGEFESTVVKGGAKPSQFTEVAGRLILTRRF